jgi:hypothetical protein
MDVALRVGLTAHGPALQVVVLADAVREDLACDLVVQAVTQLPAARCADGVRGWVVN